MECLPSFGGDVTLTRFLEPLLTVSIMTGSPVCTSTAVMNRLLYKGSFGENSGTMASLDSLHILQHHEMNRKMKRRPMMMMNMPANGDNPAVMMNGETHTNRENQAR